MSTYLESLKKESIKLKLPKTTTAVGLNSLEGQLLVDVGEFTTTINFDVELEDAESNNTKLDLLEATYDSYCSYCKHYIFGSQYKNEYLDKNALTQLANGIVLLDVLIDNISKMYNVEKINENLTEDGEYLVQEFIATIRNFILDIFPANILSTFCRKAGVNSIISAIKYEHFRSINQGITDSEQLLKVGINTLNNLISKLVEVSETNNKKIYINDSTDKNFHLFKQLNNLKLEKVFRKSNRYSFTIKDIIDFIVNNCKY
jgi:hypothetical protein